MHQALGAAGEWQRALDVYDSMKEVRSDHYSTNYYSLVQHCSLTLTDANTGTCYIYHTLCSKCEVPAQPKVCFRPSQSDV
jgi:hypothetical protein